MFPSSTRLEKIWEGTIRSSIPDFLYFILVSITAIIFDFHGSHEQFHIGYCVWNVSLLHLSRKAFIGIILYPILTLLDFIMISISHFHGSHEQFDIRYTIIKCVLCFSIYTSQNLIAILLRDCRQKAFAMLKRFCPLSKNLPPSILNVQYQNGQNTNQNQMECTYLFYIVFQVLKVLSYKNL